MSQSPQDVAARADESARTSRQVPAAAGPEGQFPVMRLGGDRCSACAEKDRGGDKMAQIFLRCPFESDGERCKRCAHDEAKPHDFINWEPPLK